MGLYISARHLMSCFLILSSVNNALRCRIMAFVCHTEEKLGSSSSQVLTKDIVSHRMTKLEKTGAYGTTKVETYCQKKKTEMASVRLEHGWEHAGEYTRKWISQREIEENQDRTNGYHIHMSRSIYRVGQLK